jgi:hypothetical protein
LLCAFACLSACAVGCGGANDDEEVAGGTNALTEGEGGERLIYFHGMSKLGFERQALEDIRGTRGLLAPSLTDAQIQAPPSANVLSFIRGAERATVAGYSLGRIPVLRLMQQNAPGMKRVVMIDPTYDSASGIGKSIGGGISRTWLDGATDRTLLFVHGDVTKELGGEKSYVRELTNHPRAELCYLPGDHERFRKADLAQAIVATSCDDLRTRLDPSSRSTAAEPPPGESPPGDSASGDDKAPAGTAETSSEGDP